jgi:hypothetical protein
MKKTHPWASIALSLAAVFAAFAPASAQRNCGSTAYAEAMMARFPEIAERQRAAAAHRGHAHASQAEFAASSIVTIPVVVHVVFNGAAQNVTDEQIYSQLEVLNEDFRLLNTDVASTPTAFQSAVADVQIQFCLASIDPDGNATSGITRTATAHGPFDNDAADDVKSTADGGTDPWPNDEYLNMWVCDISGGILGYSSFPGWPADRDGVVIDFAFFGYQGSSASPYDLGRTATHEVGHFLGLRHIWGDALCGDDGIADTPTHEDANGGCPTFPRVTSCGNSPNGEMFMNYMDYTDDRCMFMFTNDQKGVMTALFGAGGQRQALGTSGTCGGACPRARFFTDDFAGGTADFEAADVIVGWNKITAGADITYHAGDSVRLKPGFHAQAGNDFRAYIAGCAGPRPAAEMRQDQPTPAAEGFICQPNPFSERLDIRYHLESETQVTIQVVNAAGVTARTLQNQVLAPAGDHAISLESAGLPDGIYFVRLVAANGQRAVKKVVLMR